MSKRIHKAIFERELKPDDNFGAAKGEWEEVAREWVSLEPTTGREFQDANQTQSQTSHKSEAAWSRTMSAVDTSCRMKIAKMNVVDESQPNSDANFRIFGIASIVNVREQNRELEIAVMEKV